MKKRTIRWALWLLTAGLMYWGSYEMSKDTREPYEILLDSIATCAQVLLPTFDSDEKGQIDYVIVFVSIIVVLYTLFHSIRHLVRPREKAENHIKKQILE